MDYLTFKNHIDSHLILKSDSGNNYMILSKYYHVKILYPSKKIVLNTIYLTVSSSIYTHFSEPSTFWMFFLQSLSTWNWLLDFMYWVMFKFSKGTIYLCLNEQNICTWKSRTEKWFRWLPRKCKMILFQNTMIQTLL